MQYAPVVEDVGIDVANVARRGSCQKNNRVVEDDAICDQRFFNHAKEENKKTEPIAHTFSFILYPFRLRSGFCLKEKSSPQRLPFVFEKCLQAQATVTSLER